jgi:methyl-accepting chemotaxis protein
MAYDLTVKELFVEWLDEHLGGILNDKLNLGEVVAEWMSENFSGVLTDLDIDLEKIAKSVAGDIDISDDVFDIVSERLNSGEDDETIVEAIKAAVDKAVKSGALTLAWQDFRKEVNGNLEDQDERISLLSQSLTAQAKNISELSNLVFDLRQKVSDLLIDANRRPWWRIW